jgi:AAA15 family ATPase/GTPase
MLNSLVIKNFRMLEDFTVSKLGRVNLIVGKNNSGKSTVLEALRIYAGNANRNLLEEIAKSHNESFQIEKLGVPILSMPFEDLFTGRQLPFNEKEIVIGESFNSKEALHIQCKYLYFSHKNIDKPIEKEEFAFKRDLLEITKNNQSFLVFIDALVNRGGSGFIYLNSTENFSLIPYGFIPTQFISTKELEQNWNEINLTDDEEIVTQALQIIVPDFKRLAFDGDKDERWVKVKLANLSKPVSLKSLGDGMLRILQIAIKLVSAQGGFLLIDEFENGLHYSVQEKVWALLFEMAEKLDIQVFATTHSWDCIESFAAVAKNNETTEGVLFRMGRSARKSNYGQIMATVFDKDELYNITQSDVEIR